MWVFEMSPSPRILPAKCSIKLRKSVSTTLSFKYLCGRLWASFKGKKMQICSINHRITQLLSSSEWQLWTPAFLPTEEVVGGGLSWAVRPEYLCNCVCVCGMYVHVYAVFIYVCVSIFTCVHLYVRTCMCMFVNLSTGGGTTQGSSDIFIFAEQQINNKKFPSS